MDLVDRHVVVTGGANGIGEALCRRFATAGARAVVVADREEALQRRLAAALEQLEVVSLHVLMSDHADAENLQALM